VARGQDFSSSRKRHLSTEMKWVLAMLALGMLAAVLLTVLLPEGERDHVPGAGEHAAPVRPARK